jgi:ribose 1,5-bisphosphokinase PhnN
MWIGERIGNRGREGRDERERRLLHTEAANSNEAKKSKNKTASVEVCIVC